MKHATMEPIPRLTLWNTIQFQDIFPFKLLIQHQQEAKFIPVGGGGYTNQT